MSSLTRKCVLTVVAIYLGVTLLVKMSTWKGKQQVVTNQVSMVWWTLYGAEEPGVTHKTTPSLDIKNQHLLESVSASFQESLVTALPLDCHPGPEGVFKKMHAKFLQTLIGYATNHSHMKTMPSSRTLIWRCGWSCGGIGDRIKGITYSLLLSIFSHRRLIIFLDGVNEGKYLYPNMIDWRDEAAYQQFRKKMSGIYTASPFTSPYLIHIHLCPSKENGRIP